MMNKEEKKKEKQVYKQRENGVNVKEIREEIKKERGNGDKMMTVRRRG